jgi:methyl-accepting chemotaxis protein
LPFGAIVFQAEPHYHPALQPSFERSDDVQAAPKTTIETAPVNSSVNIDNAIAAHSRWKMKFRTAISKREPVDPATIHRSGCELENWLHGAGRELYGLRPEFRELAQRHDAFHIEAAKVTSALEAGKFGEARTMIAPGSAFSLASSAVNISLSVLRQSVD